MTPEIQFNRGAISAGECVSQAWEMVKRRYWLYVGMAALAFVLTSYLYCISWFLLGPLLGGVYMLVLKDERGEPVEFGMMFKGFEKFVPLMIVGLLQAVPQIILQLLGLGMNFAQLFIPRGRGGNPQFFQNSPPDLSAFWAIFGIVMIVWACVMVFAIVWYFIFLFVVPLTMEYDLPPVAAIKLSARAAWANAGGIIVVAILVGLVMLVGTLALCIGIFFISLPIHYATNAIVYRRVFPSRDAAQTFSYNPPPPSTYRDWGPGGMAA